MLIARVADHCFWFGRYLERAETTARSLDEARAAIIGAELDDRAGWLPTIIAAGEQPRFTALFADRPDAADDEELVQRYLVWDERNPTSLRNSVQAVRSNARSIRDHLSEEVWGEINSLHLWLAGDDAHREFEEDRSAFYAQVVRSMVLVAGLLRSTMLRAEPLDFIILGSMIELANQTARVLDVQHHALELSTPEHAEAGDASPQPGEIIVDTARWLALLRACGGFEPFMRRHRGRVSGRAAAAFLIQDLRFPRSIGFALDAALGRLAAIRSTPGGMGPGARSQERLRNLLQWLRKLDPDTLAGVEVHAVLTRVVDETHAICEEIGVELLGH